MVKKNIADGVLHRVPTDVAQVLTANPEVCDAWNNLTPIARNEWICWVTHVKKSETRKEHIARLLEDLRNGKRRPCCWPGCPHRNPSSKKWFSKKK